MGMTLEMTAKAVGAKKVIDIEEHNSWLKKEMVKMDKKNNENHTPLNRQAGKLLLQILAELKKLNSMVVLLGEALLNRKIGRLKAYRGILGDKKKKGE